MLSSCVAVGVQRSYLQARWVIFILRGSLQCRCTTICWPIRASCLCAKENDLQLYRIFLGDASWPVEDAQCALLVLTLAAPALPSAACDTFSWGCLREGFVAEMPSNVSFPEEAANALGVEWRGPHTRSSLKALNWANSLRIVGDHTHLRRSWLVWYS